MKQDGCVIENSDLILITGSAGYIGLRVLKALLDSGFQRIRCFARPSGRLDKLTAIQRSNKGAQIEIMAGNLLSRESCVAATKDVRVIYHLAAGTGHKSFADAFMNSVVTTRNLLEGNCRHKSLKRFVNVSSLAVYSNAQLNGQRMLDEECPIECHPESRGEAYCFAKVKQEQLVREYCQENEIPYVIVRPGVVDGPGKVILPDSSRKS